MKRNNNGLDVLPRLDIRNSCALAVCLMGFLTLSSTTVVAEESRARTTITDSADVDREYRFMGEYQGMVRGTDGDQKVGLQLVALGDGKFGGMLYTGGLPGTGWNQENRVPLSGQLHGALLELKGTQGTRVEIVNASPTVLDKQGRVLGELARVIRQSPTLGMPAPANALTLFDGVHTGAFKNGKITEDGLLEEGTELLSKYRDFTLHAEFRLPFMPFARGQARSNSGFYLQSSYEVQVLDSFGLEGVENECGALYRYTRPNQNMCLPPLQWQTYDITFRSPRFDHEGKKIVNARITVLHNGVPVHNDFEVERKTGAGKPEEDVLRPIKFQDHSNPVRFRNIWLIDLDPTRSE